MAAATAAATPAANSGVREGISTSRAHREIGKEAVWSLSTAKPGNGVEQIRYAHCRTAPVGHARRALRLRPSRAVPCPPALTTTCAHRRLLRRRRDDNCDTYWQSDGGQPHLINIPVGGRDPRPPPNAAGRAADTTDADTPVLTLLLSPPDPALNFTIRRV